jgi:hypothetical protein
LIRYPVWRRSGALERRRPASTILRISVLENLHSIGVAGSASDLSEAVRLQGVRTKDPSLQAGLTQECGDVKKITDESTGVEIDVPILLGSLLPGVEN